MLKLIYIHTFSKTPTLNAADRTITWPRYWYYSLPEPDLRLRGGAGMLMMARPSFRGGTDKVGDAGPLNCTGLLREMKGFIAGSRSLSTGRCGSCDIVGIGSGVGAGILSCGTAVMKDIAPRWCRECPLRSSGL